MTMPEHDEGAVLVRWNRVTLAREEVPVATIVVCADCHRTRELYQVRTNRITGEHHCVSGADCLAAIAETERRVRELADAGGAA